MSIAGSNFSPGVRQRIGLLLGPSDPGANQKILLVGYRSTAIGAAFDLVPQRVISEGDAVELAGEGSQLALMARAAFAVGHGNGGAGCALSGRAEPRTDRSR